MVGGLNGGSQQKKDRTIPLFSGCKGKRRKTITPLYPKLYITTAISDMTFLVPSRSHIQERKHRVKPPSPNMAKPPKGNNVRFPNCKQKDPNQPTAPQTRRESWRSKSDRHTQQIGDIVWTPIRNHTKPHFLSGLAKEQVE